MSDGDAFGPLVDVLASLGERRLTGEVYHRSGRSRRLEKGLLGVEVSRHEEEGTYVRATDGEGSVHVALSGPPRPPDSAQLELDGPPLRFPDTEQVGEPVSFERLQRESDDPLLNEQDGLALLDQVERVLREELPRARLLTAELQEGRGVDRLLNSHGVRRLGQSRVASLRLEAVLESGVRRARSELVAVGRRARQLAPSGLARRLADQLTVELRGDLPEPSDLPMVFAPEPAAMLFGALVPFFLDRPGWERLQAESDPHQRVGSDRLTLVDDPTLEAGPLPGAFDGEGVATRRVVLVERGRLHRPHLAWDEVEEPTRASGFRHRSSWREPPEAQCRQFVVAGDDDVASSDLVGNLDLGYFWLMGQPARLDPGQARLRQRVAGFLVRDGRAVGAVRGAEIRTTVSGLLRGVSAVARDVRFVPLRSAVGSPSVRIDGLRVLASEAPVETRSSDQSSRS